VSDNYLYVDSQYPEVYPTLAGLHRLIFEEEMGLRDSFAQISRIFRPSWPQPSTTPADKRSISASELPPQHHDVEFGLAHKINFSYTPSPKSDFLSNQTNDLAYRHFLPGRDSVMRIDVSFLDNGIRSLLI
jgi:hypothetical protein